MKADALNVPCFTYLAHIELSSRCQLLARHPVQRLMSKWPRIEPNPFSSKETELGQKS